MSLNESIVENAALEWFEELDYTIGHGSQLAPGTRAAESRSTIYRALTRVNLMTSKPYSLRIFVPGGDPDGLRTIEKSNWNGCGIVTAGGVVLGCSVNGREAWKTKDGKLLKEIQDA